MCRHGLACWRGRPAREILGLWNWLLLKYCPPTLLGVLNPCLDDDALDAGFGGNWNAVHCTHDIFHDAVQIYKTLKKEKPVSLYRRLSRTFNYRTRAATTGAIVDNYRTRRDITREAFVVRGTKLWNQLPASVRQSENLRSFKMGLKDWLQ